MIQLSKSLLVQVKATKDRISEYIRRFKNEKDPSIVVTVDLLTTGVDVPKIDTLVFYVE